MSKLADNIGKLLKESFPHNSIISEYYIKFKNTRLFFDYYIKEWSLLIEVQGRQHDEFVKHFHVDKEGFLAAKRRDNLKKEYCEKHNMILLEIREDMSKEDLLNKIWSVMNG